MEKKRKISPAYVGLVNFLRTRVLRNVVFLGIIFISVLLMFMLDKGNWFRLQHLKFMDGNFMQALMDALHIGQFNITMGAWILFFCILGIVVFMFVGNMLSKKIIGGVIERKTPDFRSKHSCTMFYGTLYYGAIFLICAALIFVCYMLGWFDTLKESDISVFINLLYTLLLCLIFITVIVLALVVVYFVFKLLILFIAAIVSSVKSLSKDIAEANAKAILELENAKGLGGLGGDGFGGVPTQATQLFPTLVEIDENAKNAEVEEKEDSEEVKESNGISLEDLALRFQSFAANQHKIYYGLPLIRSFLAGLYTTRLIVLEGLSGTGKSMLPRMFSEFIGKKAFFAPVQATWRDKTDMLGFYSEFSKSFKTTDFLERLYGASYEKDINLMVLDEMNLSRIEYYFADFLSVLEYPSEDWKVRVYEPQAGQTLPAKLDNGYVTIPTNTWFVGTANTDDSTFTITDKVYDRAIVIDFMEKVMPIECDYDSTPIELSAEEMAKMFDEAAQDEKNRLTKEDLNKFFKVCDFMREAFDVRFGNRIMVQIENFVPVYVALGGKKEEALDFMFARKIMRKINGMFEDYVKEELVNLTKLLQNTYGKGTFVETERAIAKITKRLV